MERVIGRIQAGGRTTLDVRVDVRLTGDRLAISGSTWRRGASDCESIGQIQDILRAATWVEGPHLPVGKLEHLLAIWDRWHLNDLRAGCEHQRAAGWDKRALDASKPLDAYVEWEALDGSKHQTWNMLAWATRQQHALGLLSEPCPTCGYKYGSAWLLEPLPLEVAAWAKEW